MKKKKCFIAIGHLRFGGIQKSLLTFLEYILPYAEVDLLVWDNVGELQVPQEVNILNIATVKSVRYAMRRHGLLSKSTYYSVLGALRQKRWKVLPKIKKKYDIAIAYTNGGFGKYFVIDKVEAQKKYTFFHNGAYECTGKFEEWDKEYYPQYDALYCVSKHIQELLAETLQVDINYDVMPCGLNVNSILQRGEEPCEEMQNAKGLKILTVGRLSPEKNIFRCIEVAEKLRDDKVEFTWLILGDGDLRGLLQQTIQEKGLRDCVHLLGNQSNPYKYMKNCDVYAQFSQYEADPITVKEVSVFSKPMVLSNIKAFQNTQKAVNNVVLCDTVDEAVNAIKNIPQMNVVENDTTTVNRLFLEKIEEMFA